MNDKHSTEASHYARLGASSSKAGVHKAIQSKSVSQYFAHVTEDVCGDSEYFSLLHADGAGTKSIVAYICYRETGDPSWFKSLAQDSLVMNLDDIAAVNAFDSLTLSNTIGRNRNLIDDNVIASIIEGYQEQVESLHELGIDIKLCGGETADVGDLVRTIIIDSTLFARVKKKNIIDTLNIQSGDIIVGLSSTGKASYEKEENSGLGSNGYTLARHALISKEYATRYTEILDPTLDAKLSYQGKWSIFESPAPLSQSIAKSLLSPTRSYAPLVKQIANELKKELHAVIHCTGGGQTKLIRFGKNKHYVKDQMFPVPPVCKLIAQSLGLSKRELYTVFNMGHRMEIIIPPQQLQTVIDIANSFSIDAQAVGFVEDSQGDNFLTIKTDGESLNFEL